MQSDAAPSRAVASAAENGPLVLFDGVCNLCSWSVQFLAPRDRGGALWYAAMQSATGQAILELNRLPADDYDSFLLFEERAPYAKCRTVSRPALYALSLAYVASRDDPPAWFRGLALRSHREKSLCDFRQENRLHDPAP